MCGKMISHILLSFVIVFCCGVLHAGVLTDYVLQAMEAKNGDNIPVSVDKPLMLLPTDITSSANRILGSSDILRGQLGTSDLQEWSDNNRKLLNKSGNSVLPKIRERMHSNYGNGQEVDAYIELDEQRVRKEIGRSNRKAVKSNAIRGGFGEFLMDEYYRKDGWEPIKGKTYGNKGIDGLYVKRLKSGTICDVLITDAKTGKAKPQNTKTKGYQLSREWVAGEIDDIIKAQGMEDGSSQMKDLKDIKRIVEKTEKRRPRVCSITYQDGKCVLTEYEVSFPNGEKQKPVLTKMREPEIIDFRTPNPGKYMIKKQNIHRKALDNFLRSFHEIDDVTRRKMVSGYMDGLKNGTIKNDSDIYAFIKKNLKDESVGIDVAEGMGMSKKRLLVEKGKLKAKFYFKSPHVWGTFATIAGLTILNDCMRDEFGWYTFEKLMVGTGVAIGMDAVVGLSMKYSDAGIRRMGAWVKNNSYMQKYGRGAAKDLQRVAPKLAKKVRGWKMGGNIAGTTFATGMTAWEVFDTISCYNAGEMSYNQATTHVVVSIGTACAVVFLTSTKYGASIGAWVGSFFCPGVGTAVGGAIGTGIGVVVGGVSVGGMYVYDHTINKEKLAFQHKQESNLAKWETEIMRKHYEDEQAEMANKIEQMKQRAWRVLCLEFTMK